MSSRLIKVFKFTMVFILVAFTANFLPTAAAQAAKPNDPPKGNNGTLKVHEKGTPSGTESNDPKVCAFNFEGFSFDPAQSGYIVIDEQNGPTQYGPYSFGPTDANGFYASNYFNDNIGPTIPNGHYKATLYGKMLPGGQLTDEKAKSKVFKIDCKAVVPKPLDPQVIVNVDACATKRKSTFATVTVTNPVDGAGDAQYTVTVGNDAQTVTLKDGESKDVIFNSLSAGPYTVNVLGDDKTTASQNFTVNTCVKKPKVKIHTSACVEAKTTTGIINVKVKNRNSYDVTYTVELGNQAQTSNLSAYSKENFVFAGLAAGTYTVTVTGSDDTRVVKEVTLRECPINPEVSTTVGPCIKGDATSTITVRVTNPNNHDMTYGVTIDGVNFQIVNVPAGSSQEVIFTGLTAKNYDILVLGRDLTSAIVHAQLINCPGMGAGPTVPTPPVTPVEPAKTIAAIPTMLPSTGMSALNLLITLLASGLTYAVALTVQRRRLQATSKN